MPYNKRYPLKKVCVLKEDPDSPADACYCAAGSVSAGAPATNAPGLKRGFGEKKMMEKRIWHRQIGAILSRSYRKTVSP